MRLTLVTAVAALPVLVAAAPQRAERGIGMSIPITKRATFVNADKTVNLVALNSHVAAVQAKISRGFANYKKNTGAPHPAAVKGIHTRATGADALTVDNGESQLWYGNISVGTTAKTFTVDFDTGSSDLFLPGSNCGSSCNGHTLYNPSASSTSQDMKQSFQLSYANDSTVTGELFYDTVSVAGLTALRQTLGVASEYPDGLSVSSFPADGLMGMAFPSISAYGATPVFQNLVSQGRTDQPVFSFKLADSGSELYLGGANSDLFTGDFTYTNVTQQGYWQVEMDGVVANGKTILPQIDSIIDTGTTLILGIPSDVKTFYDKLGGKDEGQGFYSFYCDSFPDVSFTFGGTSFPISAKSLNLGPSSSGSSYCLSAIVAQDTGSSFWTIGDAFLKNVYTTFDVGNTRVGFAQLA